MKTLGQSSRCELSLKGLLGGIGKGIGFVAKQTSGFVPGIGGQVLGRIGSALSGGQQQQLANLRNSRGLAAGGSGLHSITSNPRLPATGPRAFGPSAYGRPATQSQQAAANAAAVGLVCPPGERPNKTRYTLKSGQVVEPGTRCVKVRRMEVGNSRALRRALRRETGFAKLAKRALRGSRFKVVSANTGTRRGPRTIVESGAGSVVTR